MRTVVNSVFFFCFFFFFFFFFFLPSVDYSEDGAKLCFTLMEIIPIDCFTMCSIF